jgi:phosphopantothenoylcysteine synthetase/decarboxylase
MFTSPDVQTHHNRRCRSRPAQYHTEMSISNISRDKSFVADTNQVTLIDRDLGVEELPLLSKYDVSNRIWDRVKDFFRD